MADFVDGLEAELRSVVQRYKAEIREAYKSAGDPQALDGALDAVIAAVIRELEEAGYCFDTASVDNVLYHLGRTIKAEEGGWGVVYSR
jgi:hypothetical protein